MLVHGWQTPITAKEYNTKLPFRSTRFDLVFEATALEVLPKTEVAYVSYGAEDLSHTSSSDNTGLELSPVITRSSSSTNSFALNPSAEMFPTPTEAAQVVPSSRGRTGAVKGPSVKGGVPVNRRGQRIDLPMRIPTAAEIDKFDERIATQKLCNEHHLRDNCVTYRCKYDHQPIDAVMLNTLRYKARSIPCAQKSKCRRLDCFYGHQCPVRTLSLLNSLKPEGLFPFPETLLTNIHSGVAKLVIIQNAILSRLTCMMLMRPSIGVSLPNLAIRQVYVKMGGHGGRADGVRIWCPLASPLNFFDLLRVKASGRKDVQRGATKKIDPNESQLMIEHAKRCT